MIHLLLSVIYLAFISLGLPDGLLGAAWPTMYQELDVPVSNAGIIAMIICFGTVVSSLVSDRLNHKLGAGMVTAVSVAMTASALFGFSLSGSFWMLCLWAIPYGLGAGSVDAALNNYVALHYSSRHMSWLHCMWGIGASTGPYIMGFALSCGHHWSTGYHWIGIVQVALTIILLFSLPLWKHKANTTDHSNPLPLKQVVRISGAKEVMVAFFCYCALEQTAALWSASYLSLYMGFSEENAATLGSLFFLGITAGRAISGFVTMKLNDTQMIRLGTVIIATGIFILLLPLGKPGTIVALLLIGLGCAPVYPCIIHSTPEHFGAERSQAMIGMQMASAYIGTTLMPPLFGLVAQHIHISLLGIYLLSLLVVMVYTHERLLRVRKQSYTSSR